LLLTDDLLGRVHAQRLQQSADGFINKTQISSCRNTHELKKKEGGGWAGSSVLNKSVREGEVANKAASQY
jgi:hypothetical protein